MCLKVQNDKKQISHKRAQLEMSRNSLSPAGLHLNGFIFVNIIENILSYS